MQDDDDDASERAKFFITAHIPAALERGLLQHVRDFDTANPGCHFEIGIDGPDRPLVEMVEMLRVDPALTFTKIFERESAKQKYAAFSQDGEMVRQMSNAISGVLAGKSVQQQGSALADSVATWLVSVAHFAGKETTHEVRETMLATFMKLVERLIPANEQLYDLAGSPMTTKQ
jgi:hypothetical protein